MAAIHAPHFHHASSVRRGGIWMAAFDVGTLGARTHFGEPPVRVNDAPVTVRSELGGAGMQIRFRQVLTRTNSTLSAVRLVRNLADRHPDPAQFRNTSLICPALKPMPNAHPKSPRGRLGAISFYSSFSSGISTSIESIRSSLPSIRSAKPPHSGHITWKRSCVNS